MPLGGDVIQLTHQQTWYSQDVLNVYYFEAVDGTATLSGLASWFATNVVPDVKAMQVADISHVNLQLVNIFDLGEAYDLGLSGTGALATEGLPGFTAAGVRLIHSTAGIRSGWKRVGAANEAQQNVGLWVAGYLTLMANYADHLINPLTPALATWAHVVVQRIRMIDTVTDEVTYRLPENQTEYNPGYPVSYSIKPHVTTQNSRKADA